MSCSSQSCAGCGGCGIQKPMTALEAHLLSTFTQLPFQPVCRLTAENLAIAPFFLQREEDGAEEIEALGRALGSLAARGLISIDYEEPLQGCGYEEYHNSLLITALREATDQWKLETGSMALTGKGLALLDPQAV